MALFADGPLGDGLDDCRVSRFYLQASWDDAQHLSADARASLWASIPPYQRDARTQGMPSLGAGAVYPIALADVTMPDFAIPTNWPRVYGLDVGWNWTAAVWLAWNKDTDTVYAYNCYKRGEAEPPVHAEAIRRRGTWMPGVIDPASQGRTQTDGRKLADMYKGLGLNLSMADHAVESGIFEVYTRLSAGRLKIFQSLAELIAEYSLYQRDEKGRIKKENDHCLVAGTRITTRSGERPIERMRAGDEVWTRDGWRRVVAAGLTNRCAAVVTVTTAKGASLTGTEGHPVWVEGRGWVPLGTVRYGDILVGCQDARLSQWTKWSSKGSCFGGIRPRVAARIACITRQMASIARPAWVACTKRSIGSITARFRTGIMSITRTWTPATTTLSTWRPSLADGMSPSISPGTRLLLNEKTWSANAPRRVSGIALRPVGPGIGNTPRQRVWASVQQGLFGNVNNAGGTSKGWCGPRVPNASVLTAVSRRGVVACDWIMSRASVRSVLASLPSVGSRSNAIAPGCVVKRHVEAIRQPVYNLTVADTPEYFANGLLVHNCLDALRYAIVSGLPRAIQFPVAKAKEPEYEYAVGPGGGGDSDLAWLGV